MKNDKDKKYITPLKNDYVDMLRYAFSSPWTWPLIPVFAAVLAVVAYSTATFLRVDTPDSTTLEKAGTYIQRQK